MLFSSLFSFLRKSELRFFRDRADIVCMYVCVAAFICERRLDRGPKVIHSCSSSRKSPKRTWLKHGRIQTGENQLISAHHVGYMCVGFSPLSFVFYRPGTYSRSCGWDPILKIVVRLVVYVWGCLIYFSLFRFQVWVSGRTYRRTTNRSKNLYSFEILPHQHGWVKIGPTQPSVVGITRTTAPSTIDNPAAARVTH